MKKMMIWMLIAALTLSLAGCRASTGNQQGMMGTPDPTVGLPVETDPVTPLPPVENPTDPTGPTLPLNPIDTGDPQNPTGTKEVLHIENTAAGRTDIAFAQALEVIYEDEEYVYFFNCIMSPSIIVHYADGTQEDVKTALAEGHITIEQLDQFGIGYMKEPRGGQER